MDDKIQEYRQKVDKKLIIRQRIYMVAIIILLIINVVNIMSGQVDAILAGSGFMLTTLIGILLSRMFKIFWHEEKGKVASRLDTVGFIILVIYITVELNRKWIFQYWLTGAELNSFVLIVLTGFIFGRFLGTRFQIRSVLEENK